MWWQQHIDDLNHLLGPGWQDWVFFLGNWLFAFAQRKTILHPSDKPPVRSSLETALILIVFMYTFLTKGMIMSTISTAVLSVVWFYIAYQKWKLDAQTKTASQ